MLINPPPFPLSRSAIADTFVFPASSACGACRSNRVSFSRML